MNKMGKRARVSCFMPSVLVTGTSAGIGEQIALYLLKQEGIKVIGVARRNAPASIATHANYHHIQGDLTCESVIQQIKREVGNTLHGAVFNASILEGVAKLESMDLDAFKRVFEVNLFSVLNLTKALIPALRSAHGRAIYVSSGASQYGYQAWGAYGASKAAINHVVLTLASEEPEIVALSVAPGVVDTPMQEDIRNKHVLGGQMSESDAKKFTSLKVENKLVDPRDSGVLYGRLALHAKKDLSGKYFRYSDPEIN